MPKTSKILLIDDERDLSHLTAKWLRSAGFEVHCHYEGLNALEAVRSSRPHLILLDLILPDLSGMEICQQVRNDPELHGIPILLFTSSRSKERPEIDSLDIQGVVNKPYEPKDLIRSIRNCLADREEASR